MTPQARLVLRGGATMNSRAARTCMTTLLLTLGACSAGPELDEKETPNEQADGGLLHNESGADGTWCEVQEILTRRCASCHTEGGVGPFALESYADVTATSPTHAGVAIYQRMGARIHDRKSPMPPQGNLSDAELLTLDRFVSAGAPQGGPCEATDKPSEPATPWPEHCDATYKLLAHAPEGLDVPYLVEPNSEIHPQIVLDAPWGDEEVQAIGFRPITDNKKILHHWILNANDKTFLTGWAPGGDGGAQLPSDVGMYMPRGKASMFFDLHYFNLQSASAERDQSGVEICVLKKPNFRPHIASIFRGFASFGGSDLVLAPAFSSDHTEEGICRVKTTQPVRLLTASPHAHTYAVHMKFVVKKADGREIVMHDDDFSFEAQGSYALEEQVILETGDTVHTLCTYSNDSAKSIFVGESTTSEMCFNFAAYYPMGALSCTGNRLQNL